jgi:hypothetical protein
MSRRAELANSFLRKEDLPVSVDFLSEMTGMSSHDINKVVGRNPGTRDEEGSVLTFRFFKEVVKAYKELASTAGMKMGEALHSNEDELATEIQLKSEKVLGQRIVNQLKLGMLIEKTEATKRVRESIAEIKTTMHHFIKNLPMKIIGLIDPRDVEMTATALWNAQVKELEKRSEIIDWEVDGATNLVKTRLENIRKVDLEYGQVQ